jgi:cellobiose phosphorylase
LGIKPQYDGLLIEPCVPASVGDFIINRIFRGKKLEIAVKNNFNIGKVKILLNVDEIKGNFISFDKLEATNKVLVELN